MLQNRLAVWLSLSALAVLLISCSTRSISNSGYASGGYGSNPTYQGELNELAVLGITDEAAISEATIKAALESAKGVSLRRGDSVVVVQSGAAFPDDAMMEHMQKYFKVISLSGVPDRPSGSQQGTGQQKAQPVARSLRLAAALGGAKVLVVYWGILETGRENQVTKTVSWVPIVGSVIPDEAQQMRIRIKAAVIDVATGHWVVVQPRSFEDKRVSADINRESSDQNQVGVLKKQAYADLVDALAKQFAL
jgi:hypothetical protein